MSESTSAAIARHLFPGARVAVADGVGMPVSLMSPLAEAAASIGDVSLLLGWCVETPAGLDDGSFREMRTVMAGFGLRRAVDAGAVTYVPTRLRAVPALLAGPLKPDVLLVSWCNDASNGWSWGTEVSWMQSVVDAGVTVLVECNDALPRASHAQLIPRDRGFVVAEVERPPLNYPTIPQDDLTRAIARNVLPWIPEGCALQYGPSPICDAILATIEHPVHVRSGIVTDAVVDLDARGLLLGTPQSAYVAGTDRIYQWSDGRPIADRVENTHSPVSPSAPRLVAVNLALEVDYTGQVNVERAGGRQISGIGGHPDFAMLGSVDARGTSIVALPSQRAGRSTLCEALSAPVSTPRFDVDVFVTERGSVDVRGLSDREREGSLAELWAR